MSTFQVGQVVVATGSYGHLLTEGKQYTVTGYALPVKDTLGTFIWPEYVTVIGDSGKSVTGHTHRFKEVV